MKELTLMVLYMCIFRLLLFCEGASRIPVAFLFIIEKTALVF